MPSFVLKYKAQLVILFSLIYIFLNLFFIIQFSFYWFLGFPIILLVIYFYFTSYEKIIWLILFSTPLAINLNSFEVGYSLSLPTEPLLAGLLLLFVVRLFSGFPYDKRIVQHPVSLLLIIQFIWLLFTTLSSEYPLVSLKYLIASLWFVIPFYFMLIPLVKYPKAIRTFFWLYTIPLLFVITYTLYRHAMYGFTDEAGHWVMDPFYNDHTAYGAILALLIPFFIVFSINAKSKSGLRIASFVVLAVLVLAIIMSSSRAAWISILAVLGVWFLIRFKINYKWVLLGFVLSLFLFFQFRDDLVYMLEKNKQESSDNMAEHVQSISNISSDDSNLERINRWQAAIRLFKERPVLGWGPGTYQFVYAPFQKAKEKTSISTNAGNMGSVHSEYLGPLAEMGIPGLLLVVLLLIYIFKTGIHFYYSTNDTELKLLSLVSVLALAGYFTHGLLNNFLETDKLAIPVYGLIAIIVALDLYHKKNPEQEARI